eukprot:gene26077-11781_t
MPDTEKPKSFDSVSIPPPKAEEEPKPECTSPDMGAPIVPPAAPAGSNNLAAVNGAHDGTGATDAASTPGITGILAESADPHSHKSTESSKLANVAEILKHNLSEIKLVLQKLAGVSNTPTVALVEAVELLCKHLSVSHCSIIGYTDHCTAFVLMAAFGTGASDLESEPVMKGAEWSAAKLLEQPLCLHYQVKGPEDVENLPTDFKALYKSGSRSFIAIPIAMEHEVLGELIIAKEDADGFDVDWWEPMLGCLSMGLLAYLHSDQTKNLCSLMKSLEESTDYVMEASLGASAFAVVRHRTCLLRGTNIATGCRLALLNQDASKALIFEPEKKQGEPESTAKGTEAAVLAQIHATEIVLENTLLQDAVQKGKARFVSDCASYIQSCMKPATDIFISGRDMVASIVVLPLTYNGHTFGGFYGTYSMGLVNSVVLVLRKRLIPERDQIWETTMTMATTNDDEVESVASLDSTSSKAVKVKRTCTEAMLKVLQHEIRKTHAKSQAVEWMDELQLQEVAGKGGFGIVYKGSWKGSVSAVKVMYARQHERQAMKDALEMAVYCCVTDVVEDAPGTNAPMAEVYCCFTDVVEDASGTNAPMSEGQINVRFRRLQPDEDTSLATCNLLVMEYCDKATLRHAMKKSVFHKRLGNTSVAVDLCAIVQVLIEVAQAIQHLHSMKLVHCDIKPENVLLKSDPSKNMVGFVSKLSDFGLAKMLRENNYIVNRSGSGTVTHLAPELFQVGSRITTAVDTFSFGIMMWELYTGQRAYGGLGRDAIIDRVYKKRARPIFPMGVPPIYATLAKACWDDDPPSRPTFASVLTKLADMLVAFQHVSNQGGSGAPAAGALPAPAAAPKTTTPPAAPLPPPLTLTLTLSRHSSNYELVPSYELIAYEQSTPAVQMQPSMLSATRKQLSLFLAHDVWCLQDVDA